MTTGMLEYPTKYPMMNSSAEISDDKINRLRDAKRRARAGAKALPMTALVSTVDARSNNRGLLVLMALRFSFILGFFSGEMRTLSLVPRKLCISL